MKSLYIPIIIVSLSACNTAVNHCDVVSTPDQKLDTISRDVTTREVETRILVSKGVIRSENEVNVYSRIEGQLLDFKWLEGQKVSKGQILFRLDDSELQSKLMLSKGKVEEAEVRMEEILIGQGYRRDELDNVPDDIRNYARVKSGLTVAELDWQINHAKLGKTVINAPQSGLLTGIAPLPYSFVEPGETLCKIVDPIHLRIEFSILETELLRFRTGKSIDVKAIAYSDKTYKATIISIGTVVDEAGMIKVEATIEDTDGLLPGMTAIVSI